MSKINIEGLNKAKVLLALYNMSHVQGMGFLQAVENHTLEDAQKDIDDMKKIGKLYFDYLHGRVLKVDITGDEFEDRLFDRDCGEGSAILAIEKLKGEYEEYECARSNIYDFLDEMKQVKGNYYSMFNGHPVYIDNFNRDEVFKRLTGKTEKEYRENERKEIMEQYEE